MSRGNGREKIFLDDVDRQDFLKTLAEVCEKTSALLPDAEKMTVACRLPQETTMSRKWIARRLQTGAWTYVSKPRLREATEAASSASYDARNWAGL